MFQSVQLTVGDGGENEIILHRHGNDQTGDCDWWTLDEDDYI